MKVLSFLLAEFAALTNESKLVIAGTFDSLAFQLAPGNGLPENPVVPLPSGYLVAILEWSLAEGLAHTLQVRILDSDGNRVIDDTPAVPIRLALNPHGRPMRCNAIMRMAGLAFPGAGDYELKLLVDGIENADMPFYVTGTSQSG